MRKIIVCAVAALAIAGTAVADNPVESLDGSGNNVNHPTWGKAGTPYLRVAAPNYADGIAKPVDGPNPRYISNRIFNDGGQNLFSENDVSQWVWAWGQFMDHTFGLRDETPAESGPIEFSPKDPLEAFRNDFGAIDFSRTPAAPGSGVTSPREQINTVSSYIDAFNVYGGTNDRLDWLRDGSDDGNPTNNRATLMLTRSGYLPYAGARGNVGAAPPMDLMGPLTGRPERAVVAGDVRANENIALTAVHTLFAREHNRIVNALPEQLPVEVAFQIARRVVATEEQYITYNEFLPSVGVQLPAYHGYDPSVNASLGNEFAVVGYRAHSMIHGEFEPTVPAGHYSEDQLAAFQREGIVVERDAAAGTVTLVIPLSVAFGNPQLLREVGESEVLQSLGAEAQYKNDEQIDNSLRSVLFQVPKPGIPDPSVCGTPVINPDCYAGVADLGAIDIERGRDHGMPSYNDLRRAYGLAPETSFTAITGEPTSRFPSDPKINSGHPLDDPNILDFVELRDRAGNVIPLGSDEANEEVVVGIRRTTLAARLRAIYGDVNKIDAFVGLVSERHVPGTEMGELQLAIWKKQFEALRDGDRPFYANDPALPLIEKQFGITYRHTLSQIIELNTDANVPADVFHAG
jgi:hypothetical protein